MPSKREQWNLVNAIADGIARIEYPAKELQELPFLNMLKQNDLAIVYNIEGEMRLRGAYTFTLPVGGDQSIKIWKAAAQAGKASSHNLRPVTETGLVTALSYPELEEIADIVGLPSSLPLGLKRDYGTTLMLKSLRHTWMYKTDIPHRAFSILDDDDHIPWCRGILFNVNWIIEDDKI